MKSSINANIESLLVSASDAASLLGISRALLYQMHSTGELGPLPIPFGRRKLFSVDELRSWVNAGCPNRDKWRRMRGVTL
jgi:predicted DNA-binding transcriptional regulator AlpA